MWFFKGDQVTHRSKRFSTGTIVNGNPDSLRYLVQFGRVRGWFSCRDLKLIINKEKQMSKNITVDSLDHRIVFHDNKFKVGCQTITYEDAQKVADFIKGCEKELLNLTGLFKCNENYRRVITEVDSLYNVIALDKMPFHGVGETMWSQITVTRLKRIIEINGYTKVEL
jgi:hypothetical protein